jgi:tripartite-type tricarboxylate transporter receptor subunit TctC
LHRSHFLRLTTLVVASALATTPLLAQTASSPSRTLRVVAPFPAGASVDAMARVYAQALAQQMQQTAIVENKPGADGAIAAAELIRATPDGQTLLFATNTPILAAPTLRMKPPYDPLTAFSPVALLGPSAFFLLVHPSVPAKDLREFIAYAKANPNKLSVAIPNSTANLATAQLARVADVEMTGIPYKGESPAVPDLITGRVHAMFASTTSLLSHVAEGKLKVLAVLGSKRSGLAPQVPTVAEAGLPGVTVVPWVGIFAPAGTPRTVIERLSAETATALRNPSVVTQLEKQGLTVQYMNPEETGRFVAGQLETWTKLVRDAGIERN